MCAPNEKVVPLISLVDTVSECIVVDALSLILLDAALAALKRAIYGEDRRDLSR